MFDTVVQAFSSLFSAIIGAMFAFVIFRGGKQSDTAREQLDKVYAKAFRLIEPVMYQNIPRKKCDWLVSELRKIVTTGGILADPKFTAVLDYYQSAPDGDMNDYPGFKYRFHERTDCYLARWYDICSHIDQYYDVLCRKAFLPIRRIDYRLERNQYINRSIWLISFMRFNWQIIAFCLVLLLLTLLQLLPIDK